MKRDPFYIVAAIVLIAAVAAAVLAILLRLDHVDAANPDDGWHHSAATVSACLGIRAQGGTWYAYDDHGITSGTEGALSVEIGSSAAVVAFGADHREAVQLAAWAQSFDPNANGVGALDNVAWWPTTEQDLRAVDAIVGCLR